MCVAGYLALVMGAGAAESFAPYLRPALTALFIASVLALIALTLTKRARSSNPY